MCLGCFCRLRNVQMSVVHLVLCSLLACSSTFPREASDGAPSGVCYTTHILSCTEMDGGG